MPLRKSMRLRTFYISAEMDDRLDAIAARQRLMKADVLRYFVHKGIAEYLEQCRASSGVPKLELPEEVIEDNQAEGRIGKIQGR